MTLKSVLTTVVLIAVFAYMRYRGASPPTTPVGTDQTPASNTAPRSPDASNPDASTADDPEELAGRHRKRHHNNETTRPEAPSEKSNRPDGAPANGRPNADENGPRRDLSQDEKHHGHTLAKHIGRTDEQLLERLREEPDISSASTWNDRDIAERTIGLALEKNKAKIDAWIHQGPNRTKLAFDYFGDNRTAVGRSIRRGKTQSEPAYNAKVVLIPDGDNFHVLTSYPEVR